MDAGLKHDLEDKVRGGARLTREDGIALYASDDLAWLGGLAHEVRTSRNGGVGTFTVSRRIDVTGNSSDDGDAYRARVEETVALARAVAPDGLTGLHIEAGPHPALPWDFYPGVLRALTAALPGVSLTACTAAGVRHFEQVTGRSAADLLDELIDAGLASLAGGDGQGGDGPGTGWEDSTRIHRLAHQKGLTASCTLRYGHGEEPGHRIDHVLRLRELQDGTGAFQSFVPLLAEGPKTQAAAASGAGTLKTFAVCRLLFDNVPHIEAWMAHGERTVQLALAHGADDLGGSVVEHRTGQDGDGSGGSGGPEGAGQDELTPDDFADLIRDAGFRPVQRDARYGTVAEFADVDPGRRDMPQPMRV